MPDAAPQLRLLPPDPDVTPLRIAESDRARESGVTKLADFRDWYANYGRRAYMRVEQVPLDDISGWETDPVTGNIRHRSGRFFTIEGLEVRVSDGPIGGWSQPVIHQPEVGILGILVKEFDGILHCLMQAKVEPGNCNGFQISPTVQATRSNYSRVHGGKPVPYLEYFQARELCGVLADVRHSEQGSAFYHKRNRNMVVEVAEDVAVAEGFCWLTLGQLHRLLMVDDLINMDTRTVLACLPFAHPRLARVLAPPPDEFHATLIRSCDPSAGSLHSTAAILSWITEARARTEVRTRLVSLAGLPGWRRADGRISHESGAFFDVIGVRVEAGSREVSRWAQPMIEPCGMGIVAFLVKPFDGVLHVLLNARIEGGYVDVVELAPTVQCIPANYEHLPPTARPRFLDTVERAAPGQVRYEAVLSDEGGRFFHARNRHLIVETDQEVARHDPDFRWLAVHQLVDLLRHSHYLNIQARSLVACLQSLLTPPDEVPSFEGSGPSK
ncbi:MAG TPA: NDP-hexose 2,3-dehydratase family protein [Streptosporangiaceae bacterium]|nr:NDP-hexose 2,3-dehydratase family protein [Streptosporangiaceae bacterium]